MYISAINFETYMALLGPALLCFRLDTHPIEVNAKKYGLF